MKQSGLPHQAVHEVQAGGQAAAQSPVEPSGRKHRASEKSAESSEADNLAGVMDAEIVMECQSGLLSHGL